MKHLTKREKPANREELAVELNIEGEEQIEALRRRLRAMERDGQLVFTRRQCYALPERLDLLKGMVIGHRDGFGFLRVEGRKDDLYLSSEQMKMCMHGDEVLAQPWAPTVKAVAKRVSSAFWYHAMRRLSVATLPTQALALWCRTIAV
ncbi:winged-helix domain-containing protein [Escherichia coli]